MGSPKPPATRNPPRYQSHRNMCASGPRSIPGPAPPFHAVRQSTTGLGWPCKRIPLPNPLLELGLRILPIVMVATNPPHTPIDHEQDRNPHTPKTNPAASRPHARLPDPQMPSPTPPSHLSYMSDGLFSECHIPNAPGPHKRTPGPEPPHLSNMSSGLSPPQGRPGSSPHSSGAWLELCPPGAADAAAAASPRSSRHFSLS